MRRLRVVRVYKGLKSGGGVHNRLLELLPRLAEHVDVRLLCYRSRGDRAEELESLGIPVDVIPLKHKWSPATVARFAGYLERVGAEVVHAHEYTANTLAIAAAVRARVPVRIRHIHSLTPYGRVGRLRGFLRRRLDRWAARRAHLTWAVSEAARARYLALSGLPPETCAVLYNGIDLRLFEGCRERRNSVRRGWGIPEDDLVVGTVGRLSEGKGHEEFVEVAAAIHSRHPRVCFVLVGDGGNRPRLERLVEDAGLGGRFVFAGHTNDVPGALGAMDVFLFPSRSEGLPGAVVEAAAARLPVVGYRLPFMTEVVDDGVSGILVPPGERGGDDLVDSVQLLLSDPQRREQFGRAAAADAKRFSLDTCVEKTLRTYEDLYARWTR